MKFVVLCAGILKISSFHFDLLSVCEKMCLRKLVPLKYIKSTFACKTEFFLSLSNDP